LNTINASIITIGDELLIGQTIDTNSAFIAQQLNKIGVWVKRRTAVGDVYHDIWQALEEESKLSDIIIITGGLGPTADDITKPLLCKYFGGKLIVNEDVLNHVKYLFEKVYHRPGGAILERNLKQAEVPDTCTVLHNARGTAPGMWFSPPTPQREDLASAQNLPAGGTLTNQQSSNTNSYFQSGESRKGTVFISLPGVPHEMKGLMMDEVLPRLQKKFQLPTIIHKTAFTFGMGESMIAEKIKDFESSLPAYIKLAYLPGYGLVKLRLTMVSDDKEKAEQEITPLFNQLKELVKDVLVAGEDEGLEVTIGKILLSKGKTISTAESCTGGYIAHLITTIPGSSAYFKGSIVSYANEAKENALGVNHETLINYGAVSKETVKEMVNGALKKMNTDFALATSGIMGPDGGSDEKPVGTVWIAAGNKEKTEFLKLNLRFDRKRNIEQTALSALNFLRKFILDNG
jgi:nicotinamide-nucleotide amidase